VTVTGVDDHQNDGPRKYTIAVGIGSSGDSRYAGFDPADVSVTNLDDEPGLLITGGDDNVVTSEGGLQATFTVRLNSKPSDTVRLPLSSSDAGEGTVSPAELEFGPTDWNTPQTVTVTGVDDAMADGVQAYTVVLGALVSNDAAYAGLDPPDLAAHNRDDDFQAVVLKLLSTDSCGFPNRGGMAADGFGTLYVLLFCNSQLAVISSSDGGATFTAPVNIPDSADLGGDIAITAGAGGAVYVGFEVPGFGLMLTASHDSGVTWSQRALLTASGGNVRLAAGGQTVIATTTNPNGSTSIMMRSNDGGRSFAAPRQFDAQAIDVAVSPDGQTVWVPELSNANKLHGSSDGGATFADFGTLDLTFGPYAFGPRHLFQGGTFMQVVTLSDTTMVRTITNPSNPGQVFSVAVDSAETATMLQQANDGNHTEAVRFTESGTPASPLASGAPASEASPPVSGAPASGGWIEHAASGPPDPMTVMNVAVAACTSVPPKASGMPASIVTTSDAPAGQEPRQSAGARYQRVSWFASTSSLYGTAAPPVVTWMKGLVSPVIARRFVNTSGTWNLSATGDVGALTATVSAPVVTGILSGARAGSP
jgi:hypothetical protein